MLSRAVTACCEDEAESWPLLSSLRSWWSDGRLVMPLRCWPDVDDEADDDDARRSNSSLPVGFVSAALDWAADELDCDDEAALVVDVVVDTTGFDLDAHEKPPPPGPSVSSPLRFLFVIDFT